MNSRTEAKVSLRSSALVATIAATTEESLVALLDKESASWSQVNASLVQPIADLKDMVMRGGKRLRPAFCSVAFWGIAKPDLSAEEFGMLLSGRAGQTPTTDGDQIQQLLACNNALELIQTFALIHDDIMDGALTRRGAPTIHHKWQLLHQDLKWRGESRRVSEGVAILVGDLAFVYADIALRTSTQQVREVFDALRLEVNYGQYLDMYSTAALTPTMSDARQIAQYKSGKYSVERPLHLGAAAAGHVDEFGAALSAVGMPLGEAFQYRDDLLGVYGDPIKMGKPVGKDLVEAKPTVLIAHAFAHATSAQRERLADLYGAPDLSPTDLDDFTDILEQTGSRVNAEKLIDQNTAASIAAIEQLSVRGFGAGATQFLTDLAHLVTNRSS
jgi:geranylgeranyl diphosphate synthase type I